MSASPLQTDPIGAVFTPLHWARWLVRTYDVASYWLDGKTICDPTGGKGAFAFALMDTANENGAEISDEALRRLFLIERQKDFLSHFESQFAIKYRRQFPKQNLINADVIVNNPLQRFDFLIGNPPWANFSDLPEPYKQTLKSYFINAGLISDRRSLLLGSARVDLAALVIFTVLNANLKKDGRAAFFIPLSLLTNDGAHTGFRQYRTKDCLFSLREVWDFNKTEVFNDILARYGAVLLERDSLTKFPIPYHVNEEGQWMQRYAAPVGFDNAPLSVVLSQTEHETLSDSPEILLKKEQKPRQGVNTCGANDVFISDALPSVPREFVYPLITRHEFRNDARIPRKFVILPYDPCTGQPLSEPEVRRHPLLWDFLLQHKEKLMNRKGVMLGSWLKRGRWWALLGVGKYSFRPHKVVWEAYGKKEFKPIVFGSIEGQPWQANQALQAYIPCESEMEAEFLAGQLRSSRIQEYLQSTRAEGTCNWAQPGRIKRFLSFSDSAETKDLFAGVATDERWISN